MTVNWFARSPNHYTARGMSVIRTKDGWFARVGRRVRGPLSNIDVAMDVAAEMLQREQINLVGGASALRR